MNKLEHFRCYKSVLLKGKTSTSKLDFGSEINFYLVTKHPRFSYHQFTKSLLSLSLSLLRSLHVSPKLFCSRLLKHCNESWLKLLLSQTILSLQKSQSYIKVTNLARAWFYSIHMLHTRMYSCVTGLLDKLFTGTC